MILDWNTSTIAIYLNYTPMGSIGFYHKQVKSIDTLSLYSLTPGGAGFFSNITVCKNICDGNM